MSVLPGVLWPKECMRVPMVIEIILVCIVRGNSQLRENPAFSSRVQQLNVEVENHIDQFALY